MQELENKLVTLQQEKAFNEFKETNRNASNFTQWYAQWCAEQGRFNDINQSNLVAPKNQGNQNAAKEVTKTSYIQIRCEQAEKALIVRNLKDNEKLSSFMMRLALDEAKKRQNNSN